MIRYEFRLRPLAAFGTPLAGDTLFGQLCWALRDAHGEAELMRLLDGYTAGAPFLVASDGLPPGHLPRPALPPAADGRASDPLMRKLDKGKRWVAAAGTSTPLRQWQPVADDQLAWTDGAGEVRTGWAVRSMPRMRNNIDRLLGRPSGDGLDPFQQDELVYPAGASLAAIIDVDPQRIEPSRLKEALDYIGAFGYGRDASVGLGKFNVAGFVEQPFEIANCDGALTLAACTPAMAGIDAARTFYRPVTRFGRHGGADALRGHPFKAPVLLAAAGAVLAFQGTLPRFAGRGLGGDGSLSMQRPATVHQGYAPLWPVRLGY